MGTREGGRRPEGGIKNQYLPRIYLAWRGTQHLPRLAGDPAFTSLGGGPSIYLAWRRAQYLPRLATNPLFTSLGGEPSLYLAWRRAQSLSRLTLTQ